MNVRFTDATLPLFDVISIRRCVQTCAYRNTFLKDITQRGEESVRSKHVYVHPINTFELLVLV
jgi:hypothetical protein